MAAASNLKMIWDFMCVRKKFWLIPIIVFSLVMSLIIVATSNTVYAPFIYTLF